MVEKQLYSAVETSKILNFSTATIKRWIHEKRIKGVKVGRDWRIPKEEIERLKQGE